MVISNWGVSPTGFTRPRLADLKKEFEEKLSTKLGKPIVTTENSVIGVLSGLTADRFATLWEGLEQVYFAMYPTSATGASLDGSLAFTGQRRINAEKTIQYVDCTGVNGTVLPIGSSCTDVNTNDSFSMTMADIITQDRCVNSEIIVNSIVTGQTYNISINSIVYSYVSLTGATANTILVGLSSQISGSTVTNNVLTLNSNVDMLLSVSTNLTVKTVTSRIKFVADDYGKINPAIGTVTQIKTLITGWTGCVNNVSAVIGRDMETDTEIRQRYSRNVSVQGMAYVDSIAANIGVNVDGVTSVNVFENPTDTIDANGVTAHSIECVVLGGIDSDVAKMIFHTKPGGINTYGTTTVNVTDSQGVPHAIKFNRPTTKKVWFSVTISKNAEETYAADTPQRIKDIVLTQGLTQKVGEDVVLQKYIGNIFRGVNAIGTIDIKACVKDTTPVSSDYTSSNIVIGLRELAVFDTARIVVNVL